MKYARIKKYICLYIFIIFNPLRFLSREIYMPCTDTFMTQVLTFSGEEAKRGPGGCRHPHCVSVASRVPSGDMAWQKLTVRFPGPRLGALWSAVFRGGCVPSLHFLPKRGKLYAKKNAVRDLFQMLRRCSRVEQPCAAPVLRKEGAPVGRTRSCRAAHLFSVLSCPGRRNENGQWERALPLGLDCRRVGQLVLSEKGKPVS